MRSALTVDAGMERHYAQTDPDGHAAWWAWLTDVLAPFDPASLRIMRGTLGEGHIILECAEVPIRAVGDTVATIEVTFPAPVPPPCWPTGCA